MEHPHDSDFLTWALAGAAVLIMTVAVRINAGEPVAPGPAVHDPGAESRDSQRAAHSTEAAARV